MKYVSRVYLKQQKERTGHNRSNQNKVKYVSAMLLMKFIYIGLIISLKLDLSRAFLNGKQTCQIHFEDKHAELKELINKQQNFSLNNWSHVSGLVVIGLLGILLVSGYCMIKIKIRNFLNSRYKSNHQNIKDSPYIIFKKGMEGPNGKKEVEEV